MKGFIKVRQDAYHVDSEGVYALFNTSLYNQVDITGPANSLVYVQVPPIDGVVMFMHPSFNITCDSGEAEVVLKKVEEEDKPMKPAPTPVPPQELSLKGKVFAVDAGHGGKDPGAVNSVLGYQEKNFALDIAQILAALLSNAGATVVLTRADDTFVGLTERANIANRAKATAFISIHLNSADNKSARGFETLIYGTGIARTLAIDIQSNLAKAFPDVPNRGVKDRPDLTVLNKTIMPAVLVECGFISNIDEAEMMRDYRNRYKVATAIYQAVEGLYGEE